MGGVGLGDWPAARTRGDRNGSSPRGARFQSRSTRPSRTGRAAMRSSWPPRHPSAERGGAAGGLPPSGKPLQTWAENQTGVSPYSTNTRGVGDQEGGVFVRGEGEGGKLLPRDAQGFHIYAD